MSWCSTSACRPSTAMKWRGGCARSRNRGTYVFKRSCSMARPATPAVAADIIIELTDRPGRPIVLIERKYPPHGWALPGGFVDVGECLERAAMREAKEDADLAVTLKALLGCYSAPGRAPRGHTVTAVYIAEARGEPAARDDAQRLD